MTKPLRVLIVEDSEDHVFLTVEQIKRGGFNVTFKCVNTKDAMCNALDQESWDIAISDYQLPSFNAHDVLELIHKKSIDLPLIIISGTIGEDVAVDLMKKGARDYLSKGNLERLVVIIERELHDTEVRQRRYKAEETLKKTEVGYRTLFESSRDAIMTLAPPDWKFTSGNTATLKMFEAACEEDFILRAPWQYSPEHQPDGMLSSKKAAEMINKAMEEGSNFFEWTHKRLSGQEFPATVLLTRIELEEIQSLQATVRDITEHKKTEAEAKILRQRIEFILGATKTGLDIIDSHFKMIYIDPEWQKIYGDYKGRECYEYFMGRDTMCPACVIPKALQTKKAVVGEEVLPREGNRPVQVITTPFQNEKGEWLVAGVNTDITERKKAEEKIQHFNRVLMAIRGVNQLITKEKNPDTLIVYTCRHLVGSGEYTNAWISLFNEQGSLKFFAGDEVERDFPGVKKAVEDGKRLKCQEMALASDGIVVIEDTLSVCEGCPMSKEYKGKAALCSRLAREGEVYGTVSVSLPEALAMDKEEQDLFAELTGDLSYALSVIKTEEKQKIMQEEKEKHLEELEIFYKANIGREERIIELKKEIRELKKMIK
ncbi:MAG: PAS domain S-box protein [Candidatus Omnitrophota bacterium]